MTTYLYPSLRAPTVDAPPGAITTPASPPPAQEFRLQKIGELESFLRSEMDGRSRLHKKYQRTVNGLDGACAALGLVFVGASAVGTGLLASGVGFVPGLIIEGVTGVAGLLDVVGVAVSRRCSAEAAKHEAVRILASAKLNTVHTHISKALEDCTITDDEYKLILDEVDKYRNMKEEIRKKMAHGSPMLDEETKNELLKRSSEQARASFIKKLASTMPQSA